MIRFLSLYWADGRQEFWVDHEVYRHDGKTSTCPAHDLAHLVIAAMGTLPWKPSGTREEVCWAEYNAVTLEHLYHHTRALILRRGQLERALALALEHAAWFCSVHYAPFPVSPAEAQRRFLAGVSPELAARFFPLFVSVTALERQPNHPPIRCSFTSTSQPPGEARDARGQRAILEQLADARHLLRA